MKLRNLMPRKSRLKEGCRFDKNTGQFECESRKVLDDGTEIELGKVSGSLTASCDVSPDEVWENEEGVIDRLDKRFVSKIKGKCKSQPPQDF